MKLLLIIGVAVISSVLAEETRLEDLPPNEAQQILEKQDLSLNYAPKIDSNVPALRFLGNEQHEVLEDIYLARQFHGQDGLGGYVYGYSVPDIAKSEKKKAGGDLTGSYSYINGQGQEIKVEYWDDGTGFHQTDNLPKIELKPNEDTPEVQAAKEEHFRIWREQAERNKNYNPNAPPAEDNTYDQPDRYQQDPARYDGPTEKPYQRRPEEEEPVSDPKGFFYSFDYPVGIIVDKGRAVGGAAGQHKRETEFVDLYNKNRAILNGAEPSRKVKRSISYFAVPVTSYLRNRRAAYPNY